MIVPPLIRQSPAVGCRKALILAAGWLSLTLASCAGDRSRTDGAARPTPRSNAAPATGPSRVEPSLPPATIDVDVARSVLEAHNTERSRRGLPLLVENVDLATAAQGQADDMARRGRMSHRGSDGSTPMRRISQVGYDWRAAGENVAAGQDQVEDVMRSWLQSPGHRRNILGAFRELGVGRTVAPNGVTYWCVTFGAPAAPKSLQSRRPSGMLPETR